MTSFKSLDIRGLSFFNAFNMTNEAVNDVKTDGILEIILDKKKNFTEAFRKWASSNGYQVSGIDETDSLIRVFIKKVTQLKKKR